MENDESKLVLTTTPYIRQWGSPTTRMWFFRDHFGTRLRRSWKFFRLYAINRDYTYAVAKVKAIGS